MKISIKKGAKIYTNFTTDFDPNNQQKIKDFFL